MGGEGVFTCRAATSKGVHVNIYEYILREYSTVLGYMHHVEVALEVMQLYLRNCLCIQIRPYSKLSL